MATGGTVNPGTPIIASRAVAYSRRMFNLARRWTTARYAHLYDNPMREATDVVGPVMLLKHDLGDE